MIFGKIFHNFVKKIKLNYSNQPKMALFDQIQLVDSLHDDLFFSSPGMHLATVKLESPDASSDSKLDLLDASGD